MKNIKYIVLAMIIFILLNFSCKVKFNEEVKPELNQIIYGLASPVKLNYDTTVLILSDYFQDVSIIDKINFPKGLNLVKNKNNDTLILLSSDSLAVLDVLKIETQKGSTEIPVIKSFKKKYTYVFPDPQHIYKKVNLVGDINAWNPANSPLLYKDSLWTIDLYLEPDKYAYQVVLDGKWQLDPNNEVKVSNGMGGYNSQLVVGSEQKSPKPELETEKIEENKIYLKSNALGQKYLVMFQNHRIGYELKGKSLKVEVPKAASNIKRSYIRAWVYDDNFLSDELFIPLDSAKVLTKSSQLTRQDKETNIMYYVMVDRFKNAKKENDAPLNDPEVNPKADFHGGDIAGVTEMVKGDYFSKLGVTAIWLSPIVENPKGKYGLYDVKGIKSKFSAYHGYWPVSFTKIDKRFGTPADLNELVNNSHSKDINVLLDFVANHVHEEHPVYKKYKDKGWFTNLYLPDGTLNTEKWD
ncbi:MAG TPA: hypothetical protein ENK91_09910, partial [Bacteroidetes bacterium]|nr:hypothetical protein [Bacteroidota bacterium]